MKIDKYDVNFLYYLYRMRCFSLKQIHNFFYVEKDYYKNRLSPLISSKLITMHNIKDNYAFMITQKGIDVMQKYLNLPNEIYNIETMKTEKVILKEKDVIVEEKFASHQIALNDFVLEFRRKHGKIKYFDEKFLSGMVNIRPDGMIRLDNVDLFLEQDMGTESAKQLRDKWNRYRRYLSVEYDSSRKIVVVFILKCQRVEERNLLVRRTILETFDQLLSNNFEIYIGDKETMLNACFDRIIPGDKNRTKEFAELMQKFKFKINDGSKLKVKLGGTVYRYYFGSYDKNNRLIYYAPNKKRRGRFIEFLADNYDYCPMSVLSKISFHDKNSHNFDIAYSPKANMRLIGYIVLTRDLTGLYKQLRACELLGIKNIYYTTPERLMRMPLTKALVRFGNNGEIYSCSNYYFECDLKEGNIANYNKNGLIDSI